MFLSSVSMIILATCGFILTLKVSLLLLILSHMFYELFRLNVSLYLIFKTFIESYLLLFYNHIYVLQTFLLTLNFSTK